MTNDAYLAEHPEPDNRETTDLTQEQLQELRRRLYEYETASPAAIDNDEVGLAGPFDTLQQRLGVLLIGHARPLLSAAQRLLDIGKYAKNLSDIAEKLKTSWDVAENYPDTQVRLDRQRQLEKVAIELQALLERR